MREMNRRIGTPCGEIATVAGGTYSQNYTYDPQVRVCRLWQHIRVRMALMKVMLPVKTENETYVYNLAGEQTGQTSGEDVTGTFTYGQAELTIKSFKEYLDWLKKNGTCKCQQFFGVSNV